YKLENVKLNVKFKIKINKKYTWFIPENENDDEKIKRKKIIKILDKNKK
ncbi:hypothetical protein JJB56_15450, partial [Clostridium perfringens]|nr:hypothetical protein [Clostridium perfringens]